MLKQLTLSLILISSFSFAFYRTEKIDRAKQQAKLEAQKKHHAEKEDAMSDLETAFITLSSAGIMLAGMVYFTDECGGGKAIQDLYGAAMANTILYGTTIASVCLAAYAGYRGYEGVQHLLNPYHPAPEEIIKRE